MSFVASLSIASVLAFHPYSAPSTGFLGVRPAAALRVGPAPVEEPSGTEQPGWDEVAADNAAEQVAESAEPPPPTAEPGPGTAPPAKVPAEIVKPQYNKGTGLIIGASITGSLAWVIGLSRMAFIKQCQNALNDTDAVEEGFAAASTCFKGAGAANLAFAVIQVPMNWATWGLATGAGVVRGRYDGVDHAWSGKQSKKSGAFIGAGAALLAVGVIGRITAAAMFGRPYQKLSEGDVDGFLTGLRIRYFGIQMSSATIALGAGLLGYGIAYRKNFDSEKRRLQQVRFSPQFSVDRASGSAYTGFSLSGRF